MYLSNIYQYQIIISNPLKYKLEKEDLPPHQKRIVMPKMLEKRVSHSKMGVLFRANMEAKKDRHTYIHVRNEEPPNPMISWS